MAVFKSVVPPVVTPITADVRVDLEGLGRVVDIWIQLGSSGEVVFHDDATRRAIDPATERTIANARAAQDAGAYDILAYVGIRLDRKSTQTLAKEGTIAGLKDLSGDDGNLHFCLLDLKDTDAFLMTGSEIVVDTALFMGAHSVVPGRTKHFKPAAFSRGPVVCAVEDVSGRSILRLVESTSGEVVLNDTDMASLSHCARRAPRCSISSRTPSRACRRAWPSARSWWKDSTSRNRAPGL
jgi:dihydrodipicolinate synthase/N-acetylneuraminate lyase